MNKTNEALTNLYDLWFSQFNLDIISKDKTDCSPLKYAEKYPYRSKLVEKMKSYASK